MIDIKCIPEALREGENWPLLDIDPDWMWVSHDKEGKIVGFMLACNCHGMVFVWRLKMLPSAPRGALIGMLRRFIKDIRKRGALGYMVMLDLTRTEEQAIARIAFRARAIMVSGCFSLVVGSVNTGHLAEGRGAPCPS